MFIITISHHIHACNSLPVFKTALKAHLMDLAYSQSNYISCVYHLVNAFYHIIHFMFALFFFRSLHECIFADVCTLQCLLLLFSLLIRPQKVYYNIMPIIWP